MTSYTGRPAARDQHARDGREAYTVTDGGPCGGPWLPRPVPRARASRPIPEDSESTCVCGIARKVSGKSFQYVNLVPLAPAGWLMLRLSPRGTVSPLWLCLWLTARLCCGDPPAAAHWPPLWETPQPPLTHARRQLTRTSLAVRCYSCPMQARPPPSSAWRSGSRRSPRRARC